MPAAQLIVVLSEYWRVGYGVQPGQNLLLSMRNTLRIDDEVAEINRGARRERRDACQHLSEGQFVEENKIDPALERLDDLTKFFHPEPLDRSIADHHRDGGRAWQRFADVFNVRALVSRNRNDRVVGSKRPVTYCSRVEGGKNSGRGRKEISSMTLNEARRRTDHRNDQIGRMGREKGSQIVDERFVPLAVAEARDLKQHLVGV